MNAIKNSSSQEVREKARQEYLKASADEEIAALELIKTLYPKIKATIKYPISGIKN